MTPKKTSSKAESRGASQSYRKPQKHPLPKFGKASKKEIKQMIHDYEAFLKIVRSANINNEAFDAVKLVREQREKGND